jgi:3-oxoacyl-[acyl-carrier protein] reductase
MSENGKVLLVIGASSDMGAALIKSIHAEYSIILAHYNNSETYVKTLQRELGDKVVSIQGNFLEESDTLSFVDNIISKGYNPDHIVHLPALKAAPKKFMKDDWSSFEKSFAVSVRSIVVILKAFLPHMIKQKCGKIVFMLTSYTLNMPPKYLSSYVTEKYALLGLMKSLAVEYADKGIQVNGVSPEMVNTKFLNELSDIIVSQNAETSPIKRNLFVEEIIPTVAYLLSHQADCISGQNIGITGGK